MFSPDDIKNFAKLFKTSDDESDSSDDIKYSRQSKLGPGDIGRKTKIKIKGNEVKRPSEPINKNTNNIWDATEVSDVPHSDDSVLDPREKPDYSIIYKQTVRTEDVFLQIGNKTPTTASCECMVVIITLTAENKDEIDCHVTKDQLDIRSPKYRLNLPLPHPVDPDVTSAEWDSSTSKLNITLYLKREFDDINF